MPEKGVFRRVCDTTEEIVYRCWEQLESGGLNALNSQYPRIEWDYLYVGPPGKDRLTASEVVSLRDGLESTPSTEQVRSPEDQERIGIYISQHLYNMHFQ
jgi:hypothetical protein